LTRQALPSLVLSLSIFLASTAGAETADAERAKDLFEQGSSAFHAGEFPRALELFREAYAIDPHPILMYNIARSEESLGNAKDAIRAFRKYLELAPEAEDRGAVEQRISTLAKQLAEKQALERQRDKARRDAAAERERAKRRPERKVSPVPWIVAGAGVALVATGGVLAFVAKQKHDDAEAEESSRSAEDADESSRSYARWANVSFVAGGALAIGGTVFGVLDLSASPQGSAGLGVRGRF
jgi:tetratricopeptide (TPR) repeat protein